MSFTSRELNTSPQMHSRDKKPTGRTRQSWQTIFPYCSLKTQMGRPFQVTLDTSLSMNINRPILVTLGFICRTRV